MSNISHWMSQRLKKISQDEFTKNNSHRILKSKKNTTLVQTYYAIPLSSGCGTAILTTPKNEAPKEDFGILIILFHALGQDCTAHFCHWITSFVANGISVLSVDWDGHGVSASSLLDVQEATRSIPLIIQRLYGEDGGAGLNEKRKGPQCFLMGYSFGASLSLIAVTRDDVFKHIHGVIAIAPALVIQSSFANLKEYFCFLKPSAWIYDFVNKLTFYGFWGLLPPNGSFKRKQYPLRMKLDINYLDQAREFVKETFENRRILKKVKTPVLWFHGMKDSICPYYKTSQLMLEIKSSFFSFCDDKRGHLRMIFSDQVMASSLKFIENNIKNYKIQEK